MADFVKAPCKYYVYRGEPDDLEMLMRYSRLVYVEYRGKGKWAISTIFDVAWDKRDKEFHWEPQPSSREDDYLETHRYDSLEEALKDAEEAYDLTFPPRKEVKDNE